MSMRRSAVLAMACWLVPAAAHPGAAGAQTTQTIACGEDVLDSISAPGEVDDYVFNGLVGQAFSVTLGTVAELQPDFDPRFSVFDPNETPVVEDVQAQTEVLVLRSGVHRVEVFDAGSDGGPLRVELRGNLRRLELRRAHLLRRSGGQHRLSGRF
jgi:hypothetical protein